MYTHTNDLFKCLLAKASKPDAFGSHQQPSVPLMKRFE